MANPEHLALLKQGVGQWNEWRKQHPDIWPDLSIAILNELDLRSADLSDANLSGAYLYNSDLHGADLNGARLSHAELSGAYLSDADLRFANLSFIHLEGTDLSHTSLERTVIAHADLRTTKGLVEITHKGPSYVELHTVQLPQDGSALHFLRGCGVPDEWINDYCARMINPIQYHSCFISYSSKDDLLARRLHADLQDRGVRCWFASEDMKIGNKIRDRIDEAIHLQEKLLLLLSEHSIASAWVEDEVEIAFRKEREQKRDVLFPVRLDESVMQASQAWARKLRDTRYIGDFTDWTDPQAYQQAFKRLLRDLKKSDKQEAKMEGVDGES